MCLQGGPLFGGKSINATDAVIAPKMYHTIVALKHFKQWQLPAQMSAIQRYMGAVMQQPEWKATDYGQELIIKGWAAHLAH